MNRRSTELNFFQLSAAAIVRDDVTFRPTLELALSSLSARTSAAPALAAFVQPRALNLNASPTRSTDTAGSSTSRATPSHSRAPTVDDAPRSGDGPLPSLPPSPVPELDRGRPVAIRSASAGTSGPSRSSRHHSSDGASTGAASADMVIRASSPIGGGSIGGVGLGLDGVVLHAFRSTARASLADEPTCIAPNSIAGGDLVDGTIDAVAGGDHADAEVCATGDLAVASGTGSYGDNCFTTSTPARTSQLFGQYGSRNLDLRSPARVPVFFGGSPPVGPIYATSETRYFVEPVGPSLSGHPADLSDESLFPPQLSPSRIPPLPSWPDLHATPALSLLTDASPVIATPALCDDPSPPIGDLSLDSNELRDAFEASKLAAQQSKLEARGQDVPPTATHSVVRELTTEHGERATVPTGPVWSVNGPSLQLMPRRPY